MKRQGWQTMSFFKMYFYLFFQKIMSWIKLSLIFKIFENVSHFLRACNTRWRASKTNSDTKSRWNWPINWELHYRNNFPESESQRLSDNLNPSKLREMFKAKIEGDSRDEQEAEGAAWAVMFIFSPTNFSSLSEDFLQTCAGEFSSFQGYWLPEGILV